MSHGFKKFLFLLKILILLNLTIPYHYSHLDLLTLTLLYHCPHLRGQVNLSLTTIVWASEPISVHLRVGT